MPTNDYCRHWFYVVIFLIFVILAGLVMIFKYFLKINRKGIILEQNDRDHQSRHLENLKKIAELQAELLELKKVMNGNHSSNKKDNKFVTNF